MITYQIERNIKKIAKERGISIRKLCAAIEMTENGLAASFKNSTIKLETIETIAKVFEMTIIELLKYGEPNTWDKWYNHAQELEKENQELKAEKRRIMQNSVGFNLLIKVKKLVESRALNGLGLVYFEYDGVSKFFPLMFAPLNAKITESDYNLIVRCTMENYLYEELAERGFVLEAVR